MKYWENMMVIVHDTRMLKKLMTIGDFQNRVNRSTMENVGSHRWASSRLDSVPRLLFRV
jgi:hypothetical protein